MATTLFTRNIKRFAFGQYRLPIALYTLDGV